MLVGTGPCQGYIRVLQTLLLSPPTEKFLQNQRLSYGQLLSLLLGVEGNGMGMETGVPPLRVQLVLEGEGMEITMSSSESQLQRGKQAVTFRYLSRHFGGPRLGLGHRVSDLARAAPCCGVQPPLTAPFGDLTVPPALCLGLELSCPAVGGCHAVPVLPPSLLLQQAARGRGGCRAFAVGLQLPAPALQPDCPPPPREPWPCARWVAPCNVPMLETKLG